MLFVLFLVWGCVKMPFYHTPSPFGVLPLSQGESLKCLVFKLLP